MYLNLSIMLFEFRQKIQNLSTILIAFTVHIIIYYTLKVLKSDEIKLIFIFTRFMHKYLVFWIIRLYNTITIWSHTCRINYRLIYCIIYVQVPSAQTNFNNNHRLAFNQKVFFCSIPANQIYLKSDQNVSAHYQSQLIPNKVYYFYAYLRFNRNCD